MNERKKLIRGIVLDILFGKENVQYPPTQFLSLCAGVAAVMARRNVPASPGRLPINFSGLSEEDSLFIHEIFWDLIVERVITIGSDSANLEYPWFRLHSEAKANSKT